MFTSKLVLKAIVESDEPEDESVSFLAPDDGWSVGSRLHREREKPDYK